VRETYYNVEHRSTNGLLVHNAIVTAEEAARWFDVPLTIVGFTPAAEAERMTVSERGLPEEARDADLAAAESASAPQSWYYTTVVLTLRDDLDSVAYEKYSVVQDRVRARSDQEAMGAAMVRAMEIRPRYSVDKVLSMRHDPALDEELEN